MKFLSVCSGIDAASVAWEPLGWKAEAFSEIEKFPSAVLRHHYAETPNWGDMTKFKEWPDADIDLLVGGTPCQSFSIAGLRKGLADPRGNLALTFLAITAKYSPRWIVWENVPGVLSSDGGRDFGAFLAGLGQCGYGWAYRVLDAQYFGVPQRRRRVFVVGHLGDWRRAAAVLFERHSLQGNPAPSREAGQVAPTVPSRSSAGGGLGTDFDCDGGLIEYVPEIVGQAMSCKWSKGSSGPAGDEHHNLVAHSLRGEGFDASEDGTGRGTPLVPVAIQERAVSENLEAGPQGKGWQEDCAYTLEARNKVQSVAFSIMPMNSGKDYKARETDVAQPIMAGGPVGGNQGGDFVCAFQSSQSGVREVETHATLDSNNGSRRHNGIAIGSGVRRLTPRECERLQGFPDDYTNIPWRGKAQCPDGPRYKALGNSMAVPVMAWIGRRIDLVDHLNPSHDLSHNKPESLRGVSCVPHSERFSPEVQQNPDAR